MLDDSNRQKLAEMVFAGLDQEQRAQLFVRCLPGRKVTYKLDHLCSRPGPGKVIPLDELAMDHPALAFLRAMDYDPYEIARAWGLTLCVESKDHPVAEGRIIIPIVNRESRVGWQALHVGARDWKGGRIPRYYTPNYFPAHLAFYNTDEVWKQQAIVICAEPKDVWAIGPAGIAPLNSEPKKRTIEPVRNLIRSRPIVLLKGDNNADEVEWMRQAFERYVGECNKYSLHRFDHPPQLAVVNLPPEHSPSDLLFDDLWSLIRTQAAEQGVEVLPP